MPVIDFLPNFSKHLHSRLTSQNSPHNRASMEKEIEKIKIFFYFPDLTPLEKRMLWDWMDQISRFSPPYQAQQWKATQRNIRRQLAEKRDQGENLEVFKQSNSGIDGDGNPVSGRMMFRALEWRT